MKQRPWWLWLATASFLCYFSLVTYSVHRPRPGYGFSGEQGPYGASVVQTFAGTAAERAGITTGDQPVIVNGWTLNGPVDFTILNAAYPLGTSVEWVLERAGIRRTVVMEPLARRWVRPAPSSVIFRLTLLLSLVMGGLIAFRGDGRPTTLLAACLLASIGCTVMPTVPRSIAFDWARLPLPLELLMFPAAASAIAVPALMFTFCGLVPRPVLSARLLAVLQFPIALLVIYMIALTAMVVYAPGLAMRMPTPGWLQVSAPLSYGAYVVGAACLLRISLGRVADVTERRRLRILLAGTAAGGVGLLLLGVPYAWPRLSSAALMTIGSLIFVLMPVAFAYATLRHRLFDLRVAVRLGLQYALARGLIAALIPIAIVALIVDALLHGDQPLQAILAERGWSYATIAAIAAVIYVKRNEWMTAIDRRFFRERYAAQQILKEVVEDVGEASDLRAAATRVIGRIDSALHPVMTAVMIKPRMATAFSAVASSGLAVPALAANSPLPQIARALGKPVVAGTLGLAGVTELVVPIAVDASGDEALLVLGVRKSEEPYSKEDQDLLSAIATSLRMLMARTPAGDLPTVTSASADSSRRLANRYRIERPIGEGGMGAVYAATDETLQRKVAIKVIKDQHLTGDALARFQHEARIAASLTHPHIVTIYDFGADDTGAPFLVMELLEGRSLRHAITTDGRMAPARAIGILSGLASAVDAANAKGIVHRDLKPENVFLTTDTHAKILDYGIAKIAGVTGTNTTGGVLGTLAYMAPEQAGGGKPSPAWDIWALSVIAFEMLTGQHPFGGGLPVIRATPIRTLAPDFDDKLANAIDRALSLTPSDRPATARELMTFR